MAATATLAGRLPPTGTSTSTVAPALTAARPSSEHATSTAANACAELHPSLTVTRMPYVPMPSGTKATCDPAGEPVAV